MKEHPLPLLIKIEIILLVSIVGRRSIGAGGLSTATRLPKQATTKQISPLPIFHSLARVG